MNFFTGDNLFNRIVIKKELIFTCHRNYSIDEIANTLGYSYQN